MYIYINIHAYIYTCIGMRIPCMFVLGRHLGAILGIFGTILGPLGSILGPSLVHLGAKMRSKSKNVDFAYDNMMNIRILAQALTQPSFPKLG